MVKLLCGTKVSKIQVNSLYRIYDEFSLIVILYFLGPEIWTSKGFKMTLNLETITINSINHFKNSGLLCHSTGLVGPLLSLGSSISSIFGQVFEVTIFHSLCLI